MMVILESIVPKHATVSMQIFVPRKLVTALHIVLLAGMEPAARMVVLLLHTITHVRISTNAVLEASAQFA